MLAAGPRVAGDDSEPDLQVHLDTLAKLHLTGSGAAQISAGVRINATACAASLLPDCAHVPVANMSTLAALQPRATANEEMVSICASVHGVSFVPAQACDHSDANATTAEAILDSLRVHMTVLAAVSANAAQSWTVCINTATVQRATVQCAHEGRVIIALKFSFVICSVCTLLTSPFMLLSGCILIATVAAHACLRRL